MKFKIGDLVTPDEQALIAGNVHKDDSTYKALGEVFRVVGFKYGGLVFDRPVSNQSTGGWDETYYKLAKPHIVQEIINDLL